MTYDATPLMQLLLLLPPVKMAGDNYTQRDNGARRAQLVQ